MALTDEAIDHMVQNRANATPPPVRNVNYPLERKRLVEAYTNGAIDAATFTGRHEDLIENERLDLDDQRRHAPALSNDQMRSILHDFTGMVSSARGTPYESEVWTKRAATSSASSTPGLTN
jgi:hypothetical protein